MVTSTPPKGPRAVDSLDESGDALGCELLSRCDAEGTVLPPCPAPTMTEAHHSSSSNSPNPIPKPPLLVALPLSEFVFKISPPSMLHPLLLGSNLFLQLPCDDTPFEFPRGTGIPVPTPPTPFPVPSPPAPARRGEAPKTRPGLALRGESILYLKLHSAGLSIPDGARKTRHLLSKRFVIQQAGLGLQV